MTRLKQWGLAFQAYAAANDGKYPHCDGLDRQSGNPPRRDADKADYCGWVDVSPPYMGEKPWRDHEKWNYPKTNTMFQCPTAKLGPEDEYNYKPSRNGYFSYAMNACLELDNNAWWHLAGLGGPMPSFLPVTSISSPGGLVLLFDQLLEPSKGYGGKATNPSAGKYCGSYPKAFSARHHKNKMGLGGMILFCDYHVEWQQSVWKDSWPDDLEVPPKSDKNWFP